MERGGCDGIWDQVTGERRGKRMTTFWEQVAGERSGQSVAVFVNRELERGENRARRCLGTGCWSEERTECDGVS